MRSKIDINPPLHLEREMKFNNATVTDLGYSPNNSFDLSEVPSHQSRDNSFDQDNHERKPSYKERLAMTRQTLAESEKQELLERAGGPFSSGSEDEVESDDSGKITDGVIRTNRRHHFLNGKRLTLLLLLQSIRS